MDVIYFLLYLAAAICFALAILNPPRFFSRLNLVALGLLLWVAVPLIVSARRL